MDIPSKATPNIDRLLAPLEEVIRCKFLPAITGQSVFDDNLRNLMGLPARLGGIGVIDPCQKGSIYYKYSESITTPLVNVILDQARVYLLKLLKPKSTRKIICIIQKNSTKELMQAR